MSAEPTKELFTTIVFLRKNQQILLAMKKRGFGAGRYNGTGGKLEANETSRECAARETREEIGVTPASMEKVAELTFHEEHEGIPSIVHSDAYICDSWEGEPIETEEMAPKWFRINNLPFDEMWPDDQLWLPRVLSGDKLCCSFVFSDYDTVSESTIYAVPTFE